MSECACCHEQPATTGDKCRDCDVGFCCHESAVRTGEEPEEPRDTLPADAPIVCSVCSVPISLGDALDTHRETDGPLYCEPCHDKEYYPS